MFTWQNKLKVFAPVVLRLSIACVFAWFGFSQLFDPASWTGFVPSWAVSSSHMSAVTLVILNGSLEIIGSMFLAAGIWSYFAALILGLHLFGITLSLGLTALGVRDFGLSLATIAIFLWGKDEFSII